jgi:thioredoxin 1
MFLYTLIPAGIGLLSGGAVGYLAKCGSGTCRQTANPLRGALFGALLGAALAMAVSTPGCGQAASEPREKSNGHGTIVQVATMQEFDSTVLQAEKPVLVDFYAAWCRPCRLLAPIMDALADEYAGRAGFVKVDADRSRELLTAYNVRGYPTVLIFIGGKPVKGLVGLLEPGEYRAALDAAIDEAGGKERE